MITYKGYHIVSMSGYALKQDDIALSENIINVPRNIEVIFRRIDKGETPINKDEVPWGAIVGDNTIIIRDDSDRLYNYLKPHFESIESVTKKTA